MTTTWRAPGRSSLIGEHVDYSEGLVLPFALPFATTATVTSTSGDMVEVESGDVGTTSFPTSTDPGDVTDWASYVAGVVWALSERGFDLPGFRIEISSDIPVGAGLSSSAGLTCSVASAIAEEIGERMTSREVAETARRAENDYVGAQTGMMDQLTSMLGEQGHVLLLDCRSLDTRAIPLDPGAAGLRMVLIDTQARHELVTSEYGARRKDCEEAAAALGLPSLRDATLSQAATLSGTRLQRRAHHVISEIARVQEVTDILDAGLAPEIGGFLTASHESLRDDFDVSCEELDVTVDAALDAGALGARMVGGGFGGCVLALLREPDADRVIESVTATYNGKGWPDPQVYPAVPSRGAHAVP